MDFSIGAKIQISVLKLRVLRDLLENFKHNIFSPADLANPADFAQKNKIICEGSASSVRSAGKF